MSLFSTVDVATGRTLREPDIEGLWGCAFLQGLRGTPGVASYHFESPSDCYISYAAAPEEWKLDDGSRPPARKPFVNPTYDPETRTFTGTVRWDESAFNGDVRWEYRMIFPENFGVICGGEMRAFRPDGALSRTNRFPRHLQYLRERKVDSVEGCAFIQGHQLYLASYHFEEGVARAYISYEAAPDGWRLDNGAHPPARKHFEDPAYDAERRTFTGAVSWPEGFGGDARWEYTMVFGEDFDAIVDGQVRAFSNDGTEKLPPHRFRAPPGPMMILLGSDALVYTRYVEELHQLVRLLQRELPTPGGDSEPAEEAEAEDHSFEE